MKIAFLIDRYHGPTAGTERQLYLLVQNLVTRGCEVRLGVLRDTPYSRTNSFPAPIDVLNVRGVCNPRNWLRVYRWGRTLRQRGFGLAQTFFDDSAVLAPWPLRAAGIRVIGSRRDMGYWYSRPGVLLLLRIAAPALSAVVANCHAVGKHACAREGIAREKLAVIHNALSVSRAATGHSVTPTAAPPGGRVGILANVRPIKRVDDLLRAFAAIIGRFPDSDLVIVGGGNQRELVALVSGLSLETRVTFTGPVDDPISWIKTFSVGVLCSESEGLSNAIMEYMAVGKPVIATDTGGNPELVSHARTGLLIPVGDVRALSEALVSMLGDPLRAASYGDAGRRSVFEQFSEERMTEAYLRLYRAVLDGLCPDAIGLDGGEQRC